MFSFGVIEVSFLNGLKSMVHIIASKAQTLYGYRRLHTSNSTFPDIPPGNTHDEFQASFVLCY